MQIVSETNSILARIKWPTREACTKLLIVFKIFQIKEETRNEPIIRPRSSNISMGKSSNQFVPFWRWLISTHHWLHKSISHCAQTNINDRTEYCWTSKQIFAKYGWPDTIISNNGPCYTSQIFKGLMEEYQVNHITSLPHYPQPNSLAEKYVQIVKNLFHIAKEEWQDLHKCLMVYRNTPLSNQLQSPMQILSGRATRTSLPMSNAVRKQAGLQSEEIRCRPKNQHLPTHDLNLHQAVMYQDPVNKKWYPAKITKLCDEPRSYIITTEDGMQYRKMQMHLKPYQLRHQTNNKELQTIPPCNDNQIQLRPRNNIKVPRRF